MELKDFPRKIIQRGSLRLVSIGEKTDIHLNPNKYRKRIKVYNPITKKWIDTRPLLVGCDWPEESK